MLKRLRFPEPELPPLTEPLIIADLVITGAEIEAGRHLVRLVGWTLIGAELEAPERRIVVRLAVPLDAARTVWADLADALREQGGYGDRRPEVLAAHFRDKRADNREKRSDALTRRPAGTSAAGRFSLRIRKESRSGTH